ncbi:unannotated protein [freshwater metagenome]|uniref:Unannotated protein n=1 Tax=freshwater metagenome TaxID=449393 RepID=A0A6J6ZTR3_9ZZZZ
MAVEVAIGEERLVRELHLVTRLHAGEAQVGRLAFTVAQEDLVATLQRVELTTGRSTGEHFDANAQEVARRHVLQLHCQRDVPHVVHRREQSCHRSQLVALWSCELRVLEDLLRIHRALHRGGDVNQVAVHVLRRIEAHVTGLGPERIPVFGVVLLQPLCVRRPQPDLSHRLVQHEFVTSGIAQAVQRGELFALVTVQASERVAAAAGQHRIDDVPDLVLQQTLHVEHRAEVSGNSLHAAEVAVLAVERVAHERHRRVPHSPAVRETQRAATRSTAATEYVRVRRRRSQDLRRHELREPCALRRCTPPIDRRVRPGLRVHHITDVAHVRLHHVSTETERHRQPADVAAQGTREHILMPGVRALQRLIQTTPITAVHWEPQREPRIRPLEPAVHITVRRRLVH